MSYLCDHWLGRILGLVLSVVLMFSSLIPGKALARKQLSRAEGGTGGSEGDPLDSNDYGGGGGGGGDYEDPLTGEGAKSGLVFWFGNTEILLVPQYQGGTLVFRLVFVARQDVIVEESHAP